MINRTITLDNGRTYTFHEYAESIIDIEHSKVRYLTKSYPAQNDKEYVVLVCEMDFTEWQPSFISFDFAVQQIQTGVLKLHNQVIPVEKTLEQVKQDRRTYINQRRDLLEKDGFPYMDKIIQSDVVSSIRISVATQSAQVALQFNQPFSIDWATKDNSILTLDAMGMIGMSLAIAEYANTLHLHARDKKALIDEATTIEEVELISW